ncbi:MAG: hypothetical protein O2780_15815 [Proteobacteria bacterium]|jgi:hypothetical protein|nr:hypothetical protein [Pseudomonadota bacterium]MDA1298904.1 hypothetical protein [Pseudomonadota bacterium]
MTRLHAVILFSLVLLATGCAATTPDPVITTPQGNEILQVQPPDDWQRVFALNAIETRLVDYLPEGENESNWTAKLSFESIDAEDRGDPLQMLDHEALADQENCTFVQYFNLFSGFENNYPTSVRLFLCGQEKGTDRGMVKIIKVIQGDEYVYTIRLVSRIEAFDANESDFPKDVMASWSSYLREITLCNPTMVDHPCD